MIISIFTSLNCFLKCHQYYKISLYLGWNFFYVHCGYDIYTVDEIDKEINHKGKSNTVLLIHYYSIVKNSFEYL